MIEKSLTFEPEKKNYKIEFVTKPPPTNRVKRGKGLIYKLFNVYVIYLLI